MVAKRARIEELPHNSPERPQRGVGMHDLLWLTHSRLASRQTPLGPWSLIRAVGLPAFLKCVQWSFIRRTGLFSLHNTLSRLLLVPLSVLSRPNVVRHMRIRHDIISGSFLLDDKLTIARASFPLALNPPDLWFSCALHAYARLHTPRMSLLSDVLFSERLARQGPSSIVILPLPLVCQSHSHFSAFVSSIPVRCGRRVFPYLPYLIINHLLGTSSASRHFARCRMQAGSAGVAQPSGDDRGCVTWAPMGGSTVP
jgi:hypothetical protein